RRGAREAAPRRAGVGGGRGLSLPGVIGGLKMADRLLVSTKKGLFTLDRGPSGWGVSKTAFLGENVTLAHVDPRDGGWYAALNLGHFGTKLKFSPDAGTTWEERPVPAYPDGAEVVSGDGKPPTPATLKLIWALQSGGADQQ